MRMVFDRAALGRMCGRDDHNPSRCPFGLITVGFFRRTSAFRRYGFSCVLVTGLCMFFDCSSAAPSTASTTASTESARTSTSATASAPSAIKSAFTTAFSSAAAVSAAEQIDTVAHVNHSIAGDGIDLTVGPAVGVDRTREIRLLMENVIPLQHHCQRFSAQETMRQLQIPQQFVCV